MSTTTATDTTDVAATATPTLGRITLHTTAFGQYSLSVSVTYPGDRARKVAFVGSECGAPGPVLMMLENGFQSFVTDSARYGTKLDRSWVRNFFS